MKGRFLLLILIAIVQSEFLAKSCCSCFSCCYSDQAKLDETYLEYLKAQDACCITFDPNQRPEELKKNLL